MSETPSAWEYLVVADGDQARLSALGTDGWELVSVVAGEAGATCYLKRPVLGFRERVTLDQQRQYMAALDDPASGAAGEPS